MDDTRKKESLKALCCAQGNDIATLTTALKPSIQKALSVQEDDPIIARVIERYHPLFEKKFIEVYAKYFTLEDIEAQLAFYSSLAGKHLVEHQTAIRLDIHSIAQQFATIISEMRPATRAAESMPTEPAEPESPAIINFNTLVTKSTGITARELFEQQIASSEVAVVKFSSTHCPPCKLYLPTFHATAEHNQTITADGKTVAVKYMSISADQATYEIGSLYKVMAIPNTLFFYHGNLAKSLEGPLTQDVIVATIQEIIRTN